ncbi:hypothetical protein SAMN04515620_10263 [Collimonas sp. OK607]|nr:hypothetical protein SAMN04515620_10263 [Collimonas sp. OK607]
MTGQKNCPMRVALSQVAKIVHFYMNTMYFSRGAGCWQEMAAISPAGKSKALRPVWRVVGSLLLKNEVQ